MPDMNRLTDLLADLGLLSYQRSQVEELVAEMIDQALDDHDPATARAVPGRDCTATRYRPGIDCSGAADWDVVYSSATLDIEHERRPVCVLHGIAEVDRHEASGGISRVRLDKVVTA